MSSDEPTRDEKQTVLTEPVRAARREIDHQERLFFWSSLVIDLLLLGIALGVLLGVLYGLVRVRQMGLGRNLNRSCADDRDGQLARMTDRLAAFVPVRRVHAESKSRLRFDGAR
jgi:hypothetical protein